MASQTVDEKASSLPMANFIAQSREASAHYFVMADFNTQPYDVSTFGFTAVQETSESVRDQSIDVVSARELSTPKLRRLALLVASLLARDAALVYSIYAHLDRLTAMSIGMLRFHSNLVSCLLSLRLVIPIEKACREH